jgi:hypothetical protein
MNPDPKWLEILKDSDGWLALVIACGVFLFLDHLGWFPGLAGWVRPLAWFVILFFGSMWGLKFLPALFLFWQVFVLSALENSFSGLENVGERPLRAEQLRVSTFTASLTMNFLAARRPKLLAPSRHTSIRQSI